MINQKNYISHIERLGFENLPGELKQAHLVIMTKTDNGRNWTASEKDKELRELVKLAFQKLDEFIASGGQGKLNGLAGIKKQKYEYEEEVKFFKRILALERKGISKKDLLKLIDDLQAAIVSRKIGKHSPFAAEINYLQEGLVAIYNKKSEVQVLQFNLKKETVQKLKKAIEASKQYEKRIFPAPPPEKIEPLDLRGIENAEEEEKQVSEPEEKVQCNDNNETEETGHVMNSVDFSKLEFDSIGLKDKWLKLIGDPAPGFSAMVFGKPKMGKSYLCVDFAGYLARNHGPVLYVAREEKLDATLQKKLRDKDVAHPNLFVSDYLPEDLSPYQFVFIDSVNKLGLSPDDIEKLRSENKGKSFIFVFQTTKEGNFRGTNEFQHDVDVVIEVPEKGRAVQFGRFNQGGEMNIFEDKPLETNDLQGIKKSVMLVNSKKGNMKKSDNNAQIKMVADISDPYTRSQLKKIWEESDKKARLAILAKGGYSDKFVEWNFDDLTPAIMQSIITSDANNEISGIDWTKPKHLSAKDHRDLKEVHKLYKAGKLKEAMKYASNLDTIVREEIPANIWKEIGGKLTRAGEDELKNANNLEMIKKLKKYDERTDDLNPNYLFSTIATQLLCEAEKGDFDILYLVRRELANRGVDKNGKWVGFPQAKKIHGVE